MYGILLEKLTARHVKLVAVSKTQPPVRILALYANGQRVFGENRAQEMQVKYEALPKDIEWHMIGHLQTNKVKLIAPFVKMIHSVDSLNLLQEIDRQAARYHRVIDCLLQFHIAQESTKFGLTWEEAVWILENPICRQLQHIRICGVMGMATFTENNAQVRHEFQQLTTVFSRLKSTYFAHVDAFKEISMGMSGDWEIAVEEGSTMVRIGSLLFGERN